MKKFMKRFMLTIMILVCGFFVYFVGGLWYGFYQEHRSILIGMQNVEGARVKAELLTKTYEIATIVKNGSKYDKEGKYELAIEQYKRALDESKDNLDIWIARCALADSYAKAGQHELALEEVNWIIAQNPREEVKNEYIIRKQLLEKLIKSKKAVNVPNVGQTAFFLHR